MTMLSEAQSDRERTDRSPSQDIAISHAGSNICLVSSVFSQDHEARCSAGCIFTTYSEFWFWMLRTGKLSGTHRCSSRALWHLISAEILARLSLQWGCAWSRMTLAEMRGVISSDYPLITRPKASQWNATNHQLLCGSTTQNWRGAAVNSQEAKRAHKLPIISEPQLSLAAYSSSFRIICSSEDPLCLAISCQKKISN